MIMAKKQYRVTVKSKSRVVSKKKKKKRHPLAVLLIIVLIIIATVSLTATATYFIVNQGVIDMLRETGGAVQIFFADLIASIKNSDIWTKIPSILAGFPTILTTVGSFLGIFATIKTLRRK